MRSRSLAPRRSTPPDASVLTANSVRVGEGELNARIWKRPDEEETSSVRSHGSGRQNMPPYRLQMRSLGA